MYHFNTNFSSSGIVPWLNEISTWGLTQPQSMLEGLANRSAGDPRGLTEVRFDWMASLLRSRETSIRSTNDQQLTLSLHCFGLLLCNKSRLGFFIFYNCFIVVVFFCLVSLRVLCFMHKSILAITNHIKSQKYRWVWCPAWFLLPAWLSYISVALMYMLYI